MPCNYRMDGNRVCRPEIGEQMAEVSTAHLNIANTNATDAVSAPWPLGALCRGAATVVRRPRPSAITENRRIFGIGPYTSPNTSQPFVSRSAIRRSNQQMQVPNAPSCSHNQLRWSSKTPIARENGHSGKGKKPRKSITTRNRIVGQVKPIN